MAVATAMAACRRRTRGFVGGNGGDPGSVDGERGALVQMARKARALDVFFVQGRSSRESCRVRVELASCGGEAAVRPTFRGVVSWCGPFLFCFGAALAIILLSRLCSLGVQP